MPKDFRATTLERAIGRQLAEWRNERQLSLTEAGQRVGFSSAKLSMMENAVQPSAALDVMALGYVYKVPTPEWQSVVSQTRHADEVRASPLGGGVLYDPAEDFPELVFEATVLRTFTTDLVPPLLQIPDYAKFAVQAYEPARAAQQKAVRRSWSIRRDAGDPLNLQVVFPESVLRLVVGGRRVMKAQLLHLMEMSELDTVSAKIVPHSAGAYPAMGAPFTLLSFAHRQHNDVEKPDLTEQCAQRFEKLRELALGEADSRELMAEAVAEL